ncbi:MAG: hypothetical protein AAFR60_09380, partial [Pseudomonadota bacterium]
ALFDGKSRRCRIGLPNIRIGVGWTGRTICLRSGLRIERLQLVAQSSNSRLVRDATLFYRRGRTQIRAGGEFRMQLRQHLSIVNSGTAWASSRALRLLHVKVLAVAIPVTVKDCFVSLKTRDFKSKRGIKLISDLL